MKKDMRNIKGVGSKYTGLARITELELTREYLSIRVETEDFYAVTKMDKYTSKYELYKQYLRKNQEVTINYNSWDGLVIKESHDGIYEMAWKVMTEEEKKHFSGYRMNCYSKYVG